MESTKVTTPAAAPARTARASEQQKLELIKYFEDNPLALEACGSSATTILSEMGRQKNRTWIELAHKLNAIDGTLKPSMKWAKYWNDLIVYTKTLAQNSAGNDDDGVQKARPRPPTTTEERLLQLIGCQQLLNEWQMCANDETTVANETVEDLQQLMVEFQTNIIKV